MTDLEHLEASERQLVLSFGSRSPRIASFPHCLMRAEPEALRAVLETVDARAGIFGEWPRVDAAGEPYIGPENGRIIEDFQLWSIDANQKLVAEYAEGRDAVPFSLLIDSKTPAECLARMYEPTVDWSDYVFYIDKLSDWIGDLRWAYVPLEHEGEFVLFVVAPQWRRWVSRIRRRLQREGRWAFQLQRDGGRWRWPGPLQ